MPEPSGIQLLLQRPFKDFFSAGLKAVYCPDCKKIK
jgi:hypothetical protein